MPTRYDDPTEPVWDEPPARVPNGIGVSSSFHDYVTALESHPKTFALYRTGAKSGLAFSAKQRDKYPHLVIENRKMGDGTYSTWLAFDPDYVHVPRRSGKASASSAPITPEQGAQGLEPDEEAANEAALADADTAQAPV